MDSPDRRRTPRLDARLPVMIRSGPVTERCETVDVAQRGVFVLADRPRPERSLVRLTIALPTGKGIDVNGMVARVVTPAEARATGVPAGMGIQFYGLQSHAKRMWEGFVLGETAQPDEAPSSDGRDDGVPVGAPRPAVELRPTPRFRLATTGGDGTAVDPGEERDLGGDEPQPALVVIDPNEEPDEARAQLRWPEGVATTPSHPRFGRASGDTERSMSALDEPALASEDDGVGLPPEVEDEAPTRADPAPPVQLDARGSGGRAAIRVPSPRELLGGTAGPEPTAPAQAPTSPPAVAPPPLRTAERQSRSDPIPDGGLAPSGLEGFAVYRLAIPSVAELEGFADAALRSGGVFVRTDDVRPSGTPAVVCVVHPLSGDEFHVPGEIVPVTARRTGVAVGFTRVTERTVADFRAFIALGIPDDDGDWEELTMTDRRRARPPDAEALGENTQEVDISDLQPFDEKR